MPDDVAAARAHASEAPRIALAPSFPLVGVPSSAISARSIPRWSFACMPFNTPPISLLTCSTALSTPLPPKRFLSPSRNSTASLMPVEAPDGTIASPTVPSASVTSTATVGLPRESSTSRPSTRAIRRSITISHQSAQTSDSDHDGPFRDEGGRLREAGRITHLVVVPGSQGQQFTLDRGERQIDDRRMRIADDARRGPFVFEDRHHAFERRNLRRLAERVVDFVDGHCPLGEQVQLGDAAGARRNAVGLAGDLEALPDERERARGAR